MTARILETTIPMKQVFSIGILSFFLILIGGCNSHLPPAPSDDPLAIPFDLILPVDLSGADYYAVAGVKSDEQVSQVGDSLEEVTLRKFYAEFLAANSGPVDFDVFINTTKLERHRDGDTLRLRSTFDTSVISGDQTWRLREPGEDRFDIGRFILPTVSLLDTIGPFNGLRETKGTLRSDTALRIFWQPGATGGNMKIEWRAPGATVVRDAFDFAGSYEIPAEVMENLRGPGTVILTRYRSISEQIDGGKTIVGLRLSQRTYEVIVQ
ncbi:MAG: hypothetical protein KDD67_17295 [Ignavibacteriae bacterium]|nr:hypothetical protein [Ignavibacteriota bacterium]MCB9217423.1 hypothetical protein [Ignavibacteria bacterium]